jgi:hypothetical protein
MSFYLQSVDEGDDSDKSQTSARSVEQGPALEETRGQFVRCRVDFRKNHPSWFYMYSCYSGESEEERNSRIGTGDSDLVNTVFVRRRDFVIRELPKLYDSRYFDYDGALTSQHPSVKARNQSKVVDQIGTRSSSPDSSGQVQSPVSPFRCESHGDITLSPSLLLSTSDRYSRELSGKPLLRDDHILIKETKTVAPWLLMMSGEH